MEGAPFVLGGGGGKGVHLQCLNLKVYNQVMMFQKELENIFLIVNAKSL